MPVNREEDSAAVAIWWSRGGGFGGGGFGGGGFGRRGFDINRPHGSIYYGIGDSALNAAPYLAERPADGKSVIRAEQFRWIGGRAAEHSQDLPRRQRRLFISSITTASAERIRLISFRRCRRCSSGPGMLCLGVSQICNSEPPLARTTDRDIQSVARTRRTPGTYSRIPQTCPDHRSRRRQIARIHSLPEPAGQSPKLSLRHFDEQRQRRPEHTRESQLWRRACGGGRRGGGGRRSAQQPARLAFTTTDRART